MNKNYIIRELKENDFENYMNLMFEFTNYKYEINKELFCKKLNTMKNNEYNKILLLYSSDNENELIGCKSV